MPDQSKERRTGKPEAVGREAEGADVEAGACGKSRDGEHFWTHEGTCLLCKQEQSLRDVLFPGSERPS